MKKLFIMMFVCLFCVFGCSMKSTETIETTENELISHTDKIYVAIKTVVTDEEVGLLFDEEDIEKLKELEILYLSLKEALEVDITDENSLLALIDCADDVLVVLGKETLKEKYGTEITAIRLSTKILLSLYAE